MQFLGPFQKRSRIIKSPVTNNRSCRRRNNGYGATTSDFIHYRVRRDDDDDNDFDNDDRPQAMDESEAMDSCDPEPMDQSEAMDESQAMDVFDPEPISSPEPMDVSEDMEWHALIAVVDLIPRLAALSLKCSVDQGIGDAFNCSIDERGNFVRKSPRLNGYIGSIWFPVSDARVQRRSARLQNQKDGMWLA
jgi:hypothetical protein